MVTTVHDIAKAADQIRPYAVKTPLLEWPVLNEQTKGRVFAKAEIFQRTGSFKFRGAYNRISRVVREQFPGGVVACSSGNHAQGVAEAARLCGFKAVIVMPADAPQIKISRTAEAGADIVFYDRETEDRNAIAKNLCGELSCAFVPPFDHEEIIAGQGTAGMELAEQVKPVASEVDAVLVPTSGGGLTAGTAIAVKDRFPKAEIFCVEPKGFDDYTRSLASGVIEKNERASGSICDALMSSEPGKITWQINVGLLKGGITVSDADVRHAVAYAYRELKLVTEPGGAIALAAILSGAFQAKDRTVAIFLSGGNVDPHMFADIIAKQT